MEIKALEELDLTVLTRKSYGDDLQLEQKVAGIITKVKEEGDSALYELTENFDRVDLRQTGLKVRDEEIAAAYRAVDDEFLSALRQAKQNIYDFHAKQKRTSWLDPSEDGSLLGQLLLPLKRVGIYVPGGTAAYPSSVLMNAVPAVVAGVQEIVMVSPPRSDGSLLPEVLVAAAEAGVTEIYRVGGAQAIAALAFGTEKNFGSGQDHRAG